MSQQPGYDVHRATPGGQVRWHGQVFGLTRHDGADPSGMDARNHDKDIGLIERFVREYEARRWWADAATEWAAGRGAGHEDEDGGRKAS